METLLKLQDVATHMDLEPAEEMNYWEHGPGGPLWYGRRKQGRQAKEEG